VSSRIVEDFRGDFGAVAEMMERSWAESSTAPLLYTPEFLESCFEYPGADRSLAPALYEDDRPVAFVAGFPRRIRCAGRDADVVLITLLTAAAEHRNSGYGIVIWSELVRRAQAAGYDGMVNYCVEGEAMNRMIVAACRRLRLPVRRVFSAPYLTRMLFRAGEDSNGAEAPPVEQLLAAAAPIADEVPLARLWRDNEARWQCTREGAVTCSEGDAVLTGYVMQVANRRRTRTLLTDDVLWGSLDDAGREELTSRFVAKAAAAGAQIAVVPQLGYADLAPFAAAGFRPSQRIVHMYLTLWNDAPVPDYVGACYLDVV
jgi:GNAT superfamily N-acetyltransferase